MGNICKQVFGSTITSREALRWTAFFIEHVGWRRHAAGEFPFPAVPHAQSKYLDKSICACCGRSADSEPSTLIGVGGHGDIWYDVGKQTICVFCACQLARVATATPKQALQLIAEELAFCEAEAARYPQMYAPYASAIEMAQDILTPAHA